MNDRAIAIVGASCRFPGAAGLAAFWRLLVDGVDAVSEIGAERWSTRFWYHPTPGTAGKTYSPAAGLIENIDQFEPGFFGISPREAAAMDPQQRLLLELAWHALEDAGIPAARLAGTETGVYIGASATDYADLRRGDPSSGDQYFVTGMALSILGNRISHTLDLRGPSLVVDTACSSSLVALHQACEALRDARIDAALVGGINLLLSPYPFIGFAQAGMLSRRGRCFAFDARADGYVRGEGGGVVVLKRLDRALSDGDPIRAVVRGTAVSASGRTVGLSMPSEAAQVELLRRVYRDAEIAGDALAFIEMHGTGTPAGDPAEAAAVGRVLGQARTATLPIGSVKTNIGHLEPASGIAGLIKAMLALEHGILPRSLHGETPNPNIPFGRLNLRIVGDPEAIAPDGCAGINSFGFGGTNAHAILAAAPRREPPASDGISAPLTISARGEASLRMLAREWRDILAETSAERAPLLLRAAARRRDHHRHRLVVTGDAPAMVLDDFLAGRKNPLAVSGTAVREGRLAFVYSGNGAQFPRMGREAYHESGAFRAALAKAESALSPFLGWSVGKRITDGVSAEEFRRADIAQPMMFAIQVAITEVLRGAGVAASGFVGHSVGEIAAAWAAGGLSLADAARIVAVRSHHQERTRGTGRMGILALGEIEAREMLAEMSSGLDIAAVNSARSVTVAGTAGDIARLGEEAISRGKGWRVLDLDFAFHSAAMETVREDLVADLAGISSVAPEGMLVSTVTGRRVTTRSLDATHWWRNVRKPVRFAAAIDALIGDGHRIFVEIGPDPVLLPYLREALRDVDGRTVATLERRATAGDPFHGIAARLHAAGHDMEAAAWFDGPNDPRGLPLYPWQRERCWFGRTVEAIEQISPVCDHPLLGFRQNGPLPSWLNHLDTTKCSFLADHRIDGVPVLPAAAIVDMALAAARTRHPDAAALELRDVDLRRPMMFEGTEAREVRCTLLPDGDWHLTSRKRLADEAMTLHATARITATGPSRLLSEHGHAEAPRTVKGTDLYRHAARLGLDYGECFRTVDEVVLTGSDRAEIRLARSTGDTAAPDHLVDPTRLDGALHGLIALLLDDAAQTAGFLPRRFGRVRAAAPFGRIPRRAKLYLKRRGARSVTADITLYDATGELIAELADCGFSRVERDLSVTEHFLLTDLVPAPLNPSPPPEVLDQLPDIVPRVARTQERDLAREQEQALLLNALLAAIGLEAARDPGSVPLPAPLGELVQRFGQDNLPESGELWRLMLAENPEMVAELALTALLKEGLRDGRPRLDDGATMVAALREASPPAAAGKAVLLSVLDAIAAQWPHNRALRIREIGSGRLGDRLSRGVCILPAKDGELSDIVVCTQAGISDAADLRAALAPGGVVLAVMPLPNPLWGLVVDHLPEWRTEFAAAGLGDLGATPVSLGPWPCEVIWARAPAEALFAPSAAALSLGIVSEGATANFAESLAGVGHRIASLETADGAIILTIGDDGDALAEITELLPRVARIAASAVERRLPLWVVTSGAQQPSGDRGLIGAAVWGFSRVLRNEMAGLTLRLVDLPPETPWTERGTIMARELTAADAENEIVWTGLGRHVLRLRRGLPPSRAEPDDTVVVSSERPGRLDQLSWTLAQKPAPGPGEIAIEVGAAGVNFRDVMIATGALPEETLHDGLAGSALGLECAGTVSAVGDQVGGIAVGDRVAGFAPAAMASRVVTRTDAVMPIPPWIGFTAAATVPVAFVTALYSLATLARLTAGESVLIHAGSGAVGLAAIQIAKSRGAIVIATAGSAIKRAFLREVGADHVCDSRELRFVAAVRAATADAGVDVVLNSQHGEAMEASLALLKPFGRFVELGKRDFVENRRVAAKLLSQNLSYFSVDVDQLLVRRPELAKSLLAEIATALSAGEIRPLAHRCFTFAAIADAFRLMQSAQHIGKLVLVPAANAGVFPSRTAKATLRRDGAYVVTGGLRGFGFAAALWLAEHGAGHLALIGRHGRETPGVAARIAELEDAGATIAVYAADVADAAALARTLTTIRERGTPIRGIVHAAAAIVDGVATDLSSSDIAIGLRTKLGGALLLDRLTRQDPIDHFWLFSSATTVIGAPGQSAYVAANYAIEALARRRHAEGRPALAVAWGPIADFGSLAERPSEREALSRRLGARAMPATKALSALPAMVASGLPVVALADIRWSEARRGLPMLSAPLFGELRSAAADAVDDDTLLERLAGLDEVQRPDLIGAIIAEELVRILRLPPADIDQQRPLAEFGMDSLMAIELRLAIETRLHLDLPPMALTDGVSISALATRLARLTARSTQNAAVAGLVVRYEAPLDNFAPDHFGLGGLDLAAEE